MIGFTQFKVWQYIVAASISVASNYNSAKNKVRVMSFTLDMGGYQTAGDEINAEYDEEILFFGRAIEFIDIDQAHQHQLILPLFLDNESVHCLT